MAAAFLPGQTGNSIGPMGAWHSYLRLLLCFLTIFRSNSNRNRIYFLKTFQFAFPETGGEFTALPKHVGS